MSASAGIGAATGPEAVAAAVAAVEHATAVEDVEATAFDARPRERDEVRLLVAEAATGRLSHQRFHDVHHWLRPGDLLVINVSATVPAALEGESAEGPVRLHLSSPVAGEVWTVEPRRPAGFGSEPWLDFGGGAVGLPCGAEARFLARDGRSPRLWLTELRGLGPVQDYLEAHGQPIRYAHADRARPLAEYQTAYALVPGSAEMPSAGRPFSPELITRLVASGVLLAPLLLHCGVASFGAGERPDSERYQVGETTARLVNQARAAGGRVVAVGTTAARALETCADGSGQVHPGSGVTDLLITPQRGVRAIDGLISGWHDAGASHLDLVEAVAGRELTSHAYREAKAEGYRWHEFGDALLVLRR